MPMPLMAESGKAFSHFRTSWFDGKLTGLHGASFASALRTSLTNRSAADLRCTPLATRAMCLPTSTMAAIKNKEVIAAIDQRGKSIKNFCPVLIAPGHIDDVEQH